jgi:hypothetical protein
MQFLKLRECWARWKQLWRSSPNLFGLNIIKASEMIIRLWFFCLNKKVHGPCAPKILILPIKLMTRLRAFYQAYCWYHYKPTVYTIEILEIIQVTKCKEHLQEILSKILTKIRAKETIQGRRTLGVTRNDLAWWTCCLLQIPNWPKTYYLTYEGVVIAGLGSVVLPMYLVDLAHVVIDICDTGGHPEEGDQVSTLQRWHWLPVTVLTAAVVCILPVFVWRQWFCQRRTVVIAFHVQTW